MAISFSQRTRLGGWRKKRPPMADINVTPMVDVMLVLLVIFMVTAPLLSVGVEVDLPKAEAPALKENDRPLTVTIDAEGKIHLQETEISLDVLGARLTAITGANPDARIYVRGDAAISYGQVMAVMSEINRAGFARAALVTQAPQQGPKARD